MNSPVWRALARWPWLALLYLLLSAAIGFVLLPLLVVTVVFVPLWGLVVARWSGNGAACLASPNWAQPTYMLIAVNATTGWESG